MESIWTARPRRKEEQQSFEIVRTPPAGKICGVIASERFEGVELHYYRGRSTPCTGNDCEACEGGMRPRWTGYVFLQSATKRLVIFEFTARGFNSFQNMLVSMKDDLRGAMMTAKRMGSRPNGPLLVAFEEERRDPGSLPPVPDLREILERIWEVKEKEIPIAIERRTAIDVGATKPKSNGRLKSKS
jgi:hypothetical protein